MLVLVVPALFAKITDDTHTSVSSYYTGASAALHSNFLCLFNLDGSIVQETKPTD